MAYSQMDEGDQNKVETSFLFLSSGDTAVTHLIHKHLFPPSGWKPFRIECSLRSGSFFSMFMEITQQASVILLSSLTQAGCSFPLFQTPLRNHGDRPQKPPDAESLNLSIRGTSGSPGGQLTCRVYSEFT